MHPFNHCVYSKFHRKHSFELFQLRCLTHFQVSQSPRIIGVEAFASCSASNFRAVVCAPAVFISGLFCDDRHASSTRPRKPRLLYRPASSHICPPSQRFNTHGVGAQFGSSMESTFCIGPQCTSMHWCHQLVRSQESLHSAAHIQSRTVSHVGPLICSSLLERLVLTIGLMFVLEQCWGVQLAVGVAD